MRLFWLVCAAVVLFAACEPPPRPRARSSARPTPVRLPRQITHAKWDKAQGKYVETVEVLP